MDNPNHNIGDIELLLQKQSFKKPSVLYNKDDYPAEQSYKPQDVIKTVCSQVKALQVADCVGVRSACKNLNVAKKCIFLPLNKFPVYGSNMKEVTKVNPQKFETQCAIDTQLMDIVDCAAIIDINTGMTQEFDTTFTNTCDVNRKHNGEDKNYVKTYSLDDVNLKTSEGATKNSQTKKEIDLIANENETQTKSAIEHNIELKNGNSSIDITTEQSSQLSKTATADTLTFIENLPVSLEANEDSENTMNKSKAIDFDETCLKSTGQNRERSPSPVLNIKAIKRKLKTPPPLVVSLETFENFESVAMSLIEETDFDTAKHLINSQILGKELCFNDDAEVLFGIERENSPILQFKSDELQLHSNDLIPAKKANEVLSQTENVTEKRSEVLQDEILFSSDEEDIDIESNLLTCALETSNDHTDILEKSIYVGFQTASNKSIQISRDSYEQAQSILSIDKGNAVEEFSLTELVEKCDNLKPKHEKISITTEVIESSKVKNVKLKSGSNEFEDKLTKEQVLIDSKECSRHTNNVTINRQNGAFDVFVTASNMKIGMSGKALEKSQGVIDSKENFDIVLQKEGSTVGIFSSTSEKKVDGIVNIDENADDKINDEILLKEFHNIEMSLDEENNNEGQECIVIEGLKTSKHKKYTSSKEAIAKTKYVFQDIEMELNEQNKHAAHDDAVDDVNQPPTSKAVFEGFKTANNKEIKISDEALTKSKDVFKDIGKDKHKIKTIEDIIHQPTTSNVLFAGFKTAANKDIKISDEALTETKNIFNDIDQEQIKIGTHINVDQPSTSKSSIDINVPNGALSTPKKMLNAMAKVMHLQRNIEDSNPDFMGFKTASDKQVQISDQAIEKSRKLFSDIIMDNNSTKIDISVETETPDQSTKIGIVGLKTNKVSTETLEKSNNTFSNLDPLDSFDKNRLSSNNNKEKQFMFRGFQTANKKPVEISADALAKSKIIFNDIDKAVDTTPKMIPNNAQFEFMGFQTANKKQVEVNKDALIASKKLLNDNEDMEKSKCAFVGFQTANKKKVSVSHDALAKSEKIFSNIEDSCITTQQPSTLEPKKDIFRGFQTANKKKVEISKEALEKTKKLFDNHAESSKKAFVGFTTANNNQVKISQQALAYSRKLLQDIDTENDSNTTEKDNIVPSYKNTAEKCKTKHNFGFKTGTNKVINISEDALTKSKKLFTEHNEIDINFVAIETGIEVSKDLEKKRDTINVDRILDTQVINDFEDDVCTEDFRDTYKPNKRSGSPILVCPKAKKIKKFETPYKMNLNTVTNLYKEKEVKKPTNVVTFREDYKKNKKYTLQDLTRLENGEKSNIDPYILKFSLKNILNFEFDEARNDYNEGRINIDDIKQIFTEGTDKKLIPDGWLDIHLKLIIWKLISYEIRFPNTLGKVCTVKNVIDQLKYRYDKELYNAERSVLRKILEKDDVPSKTMVLCVAGIIVDGVSVVSAANINNIELLMTDGWYFIKATIDNMLSKLVYDGKIVIGSKIVTSGAELVNCEQGMAPWEDTSAIRLSISGNSTRPARWSEKLGLRPRTMVARLASVRMGGGKVSRLRARVVRVYPRLYVEKFQDGSTVTRSERLEHQYQMKYEAEREALIEKIYEEVEKEMSDQESQDSDGAYSDPGTKRRHYDSGSQIAKLMKISKDPMEFRAQLTSSQVHLLQGHVSKQRDRYLQAIQDRVQERLRARNVVTLARGRVAGLELDGDAVTITKGMLSIWKPNDDVTDIFREGAWIEVTNVVPTAFRNSEIQLSAGRQSVFRPVKYKEEDIFKPCLISLSRICYDLTVLSQNPSMTTEYNEVDTVGMIFLIDPSNRDFDSNKNQFQNVYLADIDKNMICVNFWGGVKKFGYEYILDTGQVIYCGNLQKRAGNTRKNISQFRATEFAIFTKTPKNEKGREMVDEMNKKLFGLDRRKLCDDCLAVKQNYNVIRCFTDRENITPYRFNNSDYSIARNKAFIETPVGIKGKIKEDFNLTGLDFESTFKQQETQLSPTSLERKRKVNEKIAKLKMYGEPPPLSPINIINKSMNATSSYRSPLSRNKTDTTGLTDSANVARVNKTQSAATPTKLPDSHIESSPIISMNQTYVKRINPVKLSFSKTDENVDHFAEEFDGSPPLSLE